MMVQIIGWTAMLGVSMNAIALIRNSHRLSFQDITNEHKNIATFLIVVAICFK